MKICVVTLFPELIENFLAFGIPRKAVSAGQLSVSTVNPRDFASDAHRTVDDRPFGGGPGMVMKVEPLRAALQQARRLVAGEAEIRTIYLSPQGLRFGQAMAREMARDPDAGQQEDAGSMSLILLAGRYEGVDERLIQAEVDMELSIGDYVLSGGEAAAIVVIDCIARLLPGVLGCSDSADQDSFDNDGLLDCPHYTRPEKWLRETDTGRPGGASCLEVPTVLLSGDHKKINVWRRQQSLLRTLERRPDLLQDAVLDDSDRQWLKEQQKNGFDDSGQEDSGYEDNG